MERLQDNLTNILSKQAFKKMDAYIFLRKFREKGITTKNIQNSQMCHVKELGINHN